jgi:CBS domain-containing protein
MGPRAAWRLESLGFTQVYAYPPGKQDWFAAGLPLEGNRAQIPTVADVVREGLPTCELSERVGEVRVRTERAGWDLCVVVNPQRIVLGVLRRQALQGDPQATAEQVMAPGPSTVRPNLSAEEILDRLRQRDLHTALVTTSEGELVGMAYREDIEATLAHEAAHEHESA